MQCDEANEPEIVCPSNKCYNSVRSIHDQYSFEYNRPASCLYTASSFQNSGQLLSYIAWSGPWIAAPRGFSSLNRCHQNLGKRRPVCLSCVHVLCVCVRAQKQVLILLYTKAYLLLWIRQLNAVFPFTLAAPHCHVLEGYWASKTFYIKSRLIKKKSSDKSSWYEKLMTEGNQMLEYSFAYVCAVVEV